MLHQHCHQTSPAAMARSLLLPSLLVILLLSPCSSAQPRPSALLLHVSKDPSTLQYMSLVHQRTPATLLPLVLDLGSRYTWVDCEQDYLSSSFRPVSCQSRQCSAARSTGCADCFAAPNRPGCNRNACAVVPGNPFIGVTTPGELSEDVVTVETTNGYNPRSSVAIPHVLFSCAPRSLLRGLATGARGMAGFGWTPVSLPSQFTSGLALPNTFAVCLPSSRAADGVVILGNSPYRFLPNVEVSRSLIYTPLVLNPVSTAGTHITGEPSAEYFIRVNSIQVNRKSVQVRQSLLTINRRGMGGTKISTVTPYTTLEASIYNAVTGAFTRESGLRRVPPVAPFGACYDARRLRSTRVGPNVPTIDLMVDSTNGFWRIAGVNSMVQVSPGVSCLAFVNGGTNPRTSIVIGGYQLENVLLQFDLVKKRLGFSNSLQFSQTTCSNFNFTAMP